MGRRRCQRVEPTAEDRRRLDGSLKILMLFEGLSYSRTPHYLSRGESRAQRKGECGTDFLDTHRVGHEVGGQVTRDENCPPQLGVSDEERSELAVTDAGISERSGRRPGSGAGIHRVAPVPVLGERTFVAITTSGRRRV